jgi:DNA-binding MarR family transcriptional regulator
MTEEVPYFKNLPRYDVLLKEAERSPEFNASAAFAFLHLLKTGTELISLDSQVLNSLGTRQGRFILLMLAEKCGAPTAAELADDTGVTRATITGLLDGLEREGLIERKMDTVDRRVVRVHLTAPGLRLLEKVRPAYCRWFAQVVSNLDEAERQQLVALLTKIQAQIARLQIGIQGAPRAA